TSIFFVKHWPGDKDNTYLRYGNSGNQLPVNLHRQLSPTPSLPPPRSSRRRYHVEFPCNNTGIAPRSDHCGCPQAVRVARLPYLPAQFVRSNRSIETVYAALSAYNKFRVSKDLTQILVVSVTKNSISQHQRFRSH
ncbi:hypothetical protein EJB05_49890, partial [Eragrostis curvula]